MVCNAVSHVVSCSAAPGSIQYLCIARRCGDGTSLDLTQDVVKSVTLSLVPDDRVIDGHRECRILLRPQQGSMCIFNITRGSTQLRVTDNESECSVPCLLLQTLPVVPFYSKLISIHTFISIILCLILVNVNKLFFQLMQTL